MKIRIKFEKTGPIRFVGHLDFMRSFQKMLKKSGLRAVYTAGFNPHMILSFAAPLGVGEESLGEYADVDFAYRDEGELSDQEKDRMKDLGLENETLPLPPSAGELLSAINAAAPEGVRAVSAKRIGLIKGSKAMALVRCASFSIELKDGFLEHFAAAGAAGENPAPRIDLAGAVERFLSQDEIMLHKKTKKSEKDVNIRPLIRSMTGVSEASRRRILLTCAQGSSENLKPAAVMEAFCAFAGVTFDPYGFRVVRLDLYDENLRPLSELGTDF